MRGHEFSDLQALVAVSERGSFVKAAADLRISPSTLSRIIRDLEERIGVTLINRTTRSLSLTGAGLRLVTRFKPAMDEMRAAIEDARELRAIPRGSVRIHLPRAAYVLFLQSRLGSFHRTYPEILLDLTIDEELANFIDGGFELSARPADLCDPSMVSVVLGEDLRQVVVASPAYLQAHGVPATPSELSDHKCINWRQAGLSDPLHWRFMVDSRWETIAVQGPLIVSHCDAALTAAIEGVGIAAMIEAHAKPFIESGDLVPLLQDFSPIFPGWRLCYPKNRRIAAATLAVVDFLSTDP